MAPRCVGRKSAPDEGMLRLMADWTREKVRELFEAAERVRACSEDLLRDAEMLHAAVEGSLRERPRGVTHRSSSPMLERARPR